MDYSASQTRRHLKAVSIEPNSRTAFAFEGGVTRTSFSWHSHGHHQLLYAPEGSLIVESGSRRYLLPPQRAGFITAGTRHRTVVGVNGNPAHSVSVFLAPGFVPDPSPGVHTMNASLLLRELISATSRWGPDHSPTPVSESCFRTLGLFCLEWIADPVPFWLPRTDHPRIRRALRFVEDHLSSADEANAAKAAAMSERTFRRQFAAAMGLTWREYVLRARMMRAADLLGGTDRPVADIAWEAGYRSTSAFTHAFHAFSGHSPGAYRRAR